MATRTRAVVLRRGGTLCTSGRWAREGVRVRRRGRGSCMCTLEGESGRMAIGIGRVSVERLGETRRVSSG